MNGRDLNGKGCGLGWRNNWLKDRTPLVFTCRKGNAEMGQLHWDLLGFIGTPVSMLHSCVVKVFNFISRPFQPKAGLPRGGGIRNSLVLSATGWFPKGRRYKDYKGKLRIWHLTLVGTWTTVMFYTSKVRCRELTEVLVTSGSFMHKMYFGLKPKRHL